MMHPETLTSSGLSLQHVGLAGSLLYMATFTLLSTRTVSGDSVLYFALNFAAAALVLISLSQAFNAAAVAIQSFWILASIINIVVRLRPGRARPSRDCPTDRLRPPS